MAFHLDVWVEVVISELCHFVLDATTTILELDAGKDSVTIVDECPFMDIEDDVSKLGTGHSGSRANRKVGDLVGVKTSAVHVAAVVLE